MSDKTLQETFRPARDAHHYGGTIGLTKFEGIVLEIYKALFVPPNKERLDWKISAQEQIKTAVILAGIFIEEMEKQGIK